MRKRLWNALVLTALTMIASAASGAALPLDANGWSILTPSADSRLIYVSSVSGSDATGVAYLPSDPLIGADPFHPVGAIMPFATYAGAYARTRDGFPDWVLFKRGESWTTGLTGGMRNGRSDTQRMVVTSYGNSSERPLFKTGTGGGLSINSGSGGRLWVQYMAIVGLHYYSQMRDPSSPDFAGYSNGSTGISFLSQSSNGYVGNTRDILVEDCQIEWYGNNMNAQAGGTSFLRDLVVRRNVINNAYQATTTPTVAHSQGMFASNSSSITLEENVFDHNGWYFTGAEAQGGATIFNHNTYFSFTRDITFRGNMFLRASSIGTKWCSNNGDHTSNVTLDDNLYVEGEIGMQIGGNGTDPYGFSNITVTNNVMEAIGRARPTARTLSWGLWMWDWDGGLVDGNLFIRQDTTAVNNTYAISVEGVSNRNIQIRNNTVYQLFSAGRLIILTGGTSYSAISLTNNIVDTNAYTSQLVDAGGTLAPYTLSNNRYFTAATASSWFRASGVGKTFAQWAALAGEAGSTTGHGDFSDPTRTAETYNATQGGPGTFADFITQAKMQSRANWRTAYTAAAVNDYIRAGFAPTAPTPTPSPTPTRTPTPTAPSSAGDFWLFQ